VSLRAAPALKRGLTLVEAIIGITIISIAFYVLIAVFIALLPRAIKLENIDKKIYLAQEKMEEYLAQPYTQMSTAGATGNFTGSFSIYAYNVAVTNVATADLSTPAASNLKKIRVSVWGGPVDALSTVEVVSLAVTYEVK
jgi:type II secretory pathway pseudopilin PulG